MIICCSGFIGSGKDTVADYFVNFHQFKRYAFADSLKDTLSMIFGWDRELLEGRSKESRVWRELPDEWWSNRLGLPITPRWAMMNFGTEVCRNHFHTDIWIASLQNKLMKTSNDVIITDARFINEIECMKNLGAKFVKVHREYPEWYDLGCLAAFGDNDAAERLSNMGIHSSEWQWLATDFDNEIENTESIDALYSKLKQLIQ